MDDKNKKVYDFSKGNLINLIVILISVAYVFYGMVKFGRTDLTIEEQIAKAGIGIVIGLLIKQGIGENGFNKGYNSKVWNESLEKYSNACNLVNPYLERVDNFYLYEEIEKKKQYRRMVLMENQMKYDWFFDEKGNYIDNRERYEKLDKKQVKALKKAIRVKIYNLNLFSERKPTKIKEQRCLGKMVWLKLWGLLLGLMCYLCGMVGIGVRLLRQRFKLLYGYFVELLNYIRIIII